MAKSDDFAYNKGMRVNAVIRTQTIGIGSKSNFMRAMKHRLRGSLEENEYEKIDEYANKIYNAFSLLESGGKKLRKNATVQELVIAFDRKITNEEENIIKQIIKSRLEEILTFKPSSVIFTHNKDNRTHIHVIFSLRDPKNINKPKFRWKKQHHIRLVNNLLQDFGADKSLENLRRKKPKKPYPLWLVQGIKKRLGHDKYRILMDYALQERLKTHELMTLVHEYLDEWETLGIEEFKKKMKGLQLKEQLKQIHLDIDLDTLENDLRLEL